MIWLYFAHCLVLVSVPAFSEQVKQYLSCFCVAYLVHPQRDTNAWIYQSSVFIMAVRHHGWIQAWQYSIYGRFHLHNTAMIYLMLNVSLLFSLNRRLTWSSILTSMPTPPWWMASCMGTSLKMRKSFSDRLFSPSYSVRMPKTFLM